MISPSYQEKRISKFSGKKVITMSNKYFQPEQETMPLEELKKLQSEKLVRQVRYVYDNVRYYRDLMDEKGAGSISLRIAGNRQAQLRENSVYLRHHRQACGCFLYTKRCRYVGGLLCKSFGGSRRYR